MVRSRADRTFQLRPRELALDEWRERFAELPTSNAMFPLRHYYADGLGGRDDTGDDDAYSQEEVSRFVAHLADRGLLPLPPAPPAPRSLRRAISDAA